MSVCQSAGVSSVYKGESLPLVVQNKDRVYKKLFFFLPGVMYPDLSIKYKKFLEVLKGRNFANTAMTSYTRRKYANILSMNPSSLSSWEDL